MTSQKMTSQENVPAILRTVNDVRAFVAAARKAGQTVALVPTMGALHDGHLTLVRAAQEKADIVIVSIFVNPTQFGPQEDFSAYPRTWDADVEQLTAVGTQAVFYPDVAVMYPQGHGTTVTVSGVTDPLEGAHRPGHFDGVATIVCKLLLSVAPDYALFGEKDWQQLQVIRRMVADLNIDVTIEGVPTVRDADGLALSSRNAYLSAEELQIARQLNRILRLAGEAVRAGRDVPAAEAEAAQRVLDAGFAGVDYIAIRHAQTLAPVSAGETPDEWRILAAVRLGKARLIDNMAV